MRIAAAGVNAPGLIEVAKNPKGDGFVKRPGIVRLSASLLLGWSSRAQW
ncbi:hypothetical protein WHZ77_21605 [Bradyrhizobium sp. A5]